MLTFDRQVRYGESRSDANGEWIVDYGLRFDGTSVVVSVGIAFLPPSIFLNGDNFGGDVPKEKLKKTWEKGAEKIWNGKALFDDGENLYPVVLDVRFVPYDEGHVDSFAPDGWNHLVTFHDGAGRFDMLNWYTTPKEWGSGFRAEAAAHEVGHMIGNFDEYSGGATLGGFITTDTLMSDLTPGGFERYFWGIEYKTENFGLGDWSGTGLDLVMARRGDNGADKMNGKAVSEAFFSLGGDDKVVAAGGHDYIDGGGGDDMLLGGSNKDRIFGNTGNDRLSGGIAVDILDGGSGKDRYYFKEPPATSGPDIVRSFEPGKDLVCLDRKIFTALEKGKLPGKNFWYADDVAVRKKDHVGYDPTTGALYYDNDGGDPPGDLDIGLTIVAYLPVGLSDFDQGDILVV